MDDRPLVDQDAAPERDDPADGTRREALARMGRLAAYTSPVMLTLLTTKEAAAWKGSNTGGETGWPTWPTWPWS